MGFSQCTYNTKKIAEALRIEEDDLVDLMMENAYGGYARIWSVENNGKYSTAKISISKKNKETDEYVTDFQDGFVRLIGQAHNALKDVSVGDKGISVRITQCEVTNLYTSPEGKVSYKPHYIIFGLEVMDKQFKKENNNKGSNAKSAKKSGSDEFMNIPDGTDDDELPFD